MQWGIRAFLACYPTGLLSGSVGSSTLVCPPPDQTFGHGIELMLFPSASIPGMEKLCSEKENTYPGTFIPDFFMAYI